MMLETSIEQIAEQLITFCRHLYDKDLLVGTDGNVSARVDDQTLLITNSGTHKGLLSDSDLATVQMDGTVLSGTPSSELSMHLEIYSRCPTAGAVIHTHPAIATAWGISSNDRGGLPVERLTETMLTFGRIPFVPYARPGTQELADALIPYLPDCRALILRHHGAICWGETLHNAFCCTEHLEHTAKTLWYSEAFDEPISLPADALEDLRQLRQRLETKAHETI